MNSKKIKSFLWGAAAAAVLFHSVPALAESFQTIEAIFGRVGLMVDGVKVEQETLLYDGTTYVPLRAAAEILGKEVNWNEKTNTADIISPVVEENLPKDEKLEEIEPEIIDNEDGDDDDFIQNEIEEELTYNMYDLKLPAEKDVYILKFLYRGKECVFSDGVIVRMHFYTDGSVRVEMKNNDEEFVRNSQPTI
ncbi:copper amine oxidase N-terminal domain-containing protein, partial [Tyzzerella sp. OttesenSCG-928-J15]|nr:copper amine oxidase N-terminal domain-containing protein [Tyzzerella sp. OttesenSCG-928-J15]